MTTDEKSLTEATEATDTTIVDEAAETTEPEAEGEPGSEAEATDAPDVAAAAESPRSLKTLITVVALAVLLAASAALTGWLYFAKYRPDQQTGAAAQQQVLDAAKAGTVAALSYSPDDLDGDLNTAKSHLTGDFLTYYTKFTDDVVRKAVNDRKVSTTAQVVRLAVSEMNPDSAKVLVFVNQSTVSNDRPDPSMSASSVLVTMTKVDGRWLISAFDPV